LKVRVGDILAGVGYDTAETLASLRSGLAACLDDAGRDRPAVFGVRTVKVGWRRRRVALVLHGLRVRARADTVDDAVAGLAAVLGDLIGQTRPGEVRVAARVLTKGDDAVLYVPGTAAEVDDRPLLDAGILEAPVWRATVDTATFEVVTPAGRHQLTAMVLADPNADDSVDGSRRYLWALADGGDLDGWARLLDTRPELIRRVARDAAAATILSVLH